MCGGGQATEAMQVQQWAESHKATYDEQARDEGRQESRPDLEAQGPRERLGRPVTHQDSGGLGPSKFDRAVTSPVAQSGDLKWKKPLPAPEKGMGERSATASALVEDFECDDLPRQRAVTEPPRRQQSPFTFLDNVLDNDTSMHCAQKSSTAGYQNLAVNLLLCVVTLVAGCLFPVLVDFSKTATRRLPDGQEVQMLPYSVFDIPVAEAAINVGLGILVMRCKVCNLLLSRELHMQMLPLTLAYWLADIFALAAIDTGGAPLYASISNTRLLFAAAASQCLLDRRQSGRQWLILAWITLFTVFFAFSENRSRKRGGSGGSVKPIVGLCWALGKAFLSGVAAVLSEKSYRSLTIWQANTLIKGQSLVVAGVGGILYDRFKINHVPICGSSEHTGGQCIDHRGWDFWTWAVLAAAIGTGWLHVLVLTRMSAVAKFICKTATAPALYLLYCITSARDFRFSWPSFMAVTAIAAGILLYSGEAYMASYCARLPTWVMHYGGTRRTS